MIPIPSFLINFVTLRVLRIGLGWVGNTIVGGGGGGWGWGVSVVDDLPVPLLTEEDVLIEILARLPVISLLRFKSVSKSWRDLIQSSFFIHLHTTTTFDYSSSSSSKQLGGGSTYILQMSPFILGAGGWVREMKMFMLSFGSGGSSDGDDDQVVFKMDDLDFPPYYKFFPLKKMILMVGSCNGLICLHDLKHRDVSLWNPATRQFRILPKSITIQDEEGIGKFSYDFLAFGFDVKTKDYKVVQISCFSPIYIEQLRPAECICRVQVYSLSTDSWRLLESINYLPAKPIHVHIWEQTQLGLYLNGSYFFLGKKCPPKPLSVEEEYNQQGEEIRNESLMFSFDFTKEIFATMPLPDHDRRYDFLVTHLGDKIALFTTRIRSLLERQEGDGRSRCLDCRRIKSSFPPGGGGDDDQSRCDCDDEDYENYDIWVLNEQQGGGGGGGDHDNVNKESWAKLHSFRTKYRVARDWVRPIGILNNGEFALTETKTAYRDEVFNELQLLNLVTKVPTKSFPISERVLRSSIYKQSLVSIIGGNGTAAAAAANRVVGGAMCPIVN